MYLVKSKINYKIIFLSILGFIFLGLTVLQPDTSKADSRFIAQNCSAGSTSCHSDKIKLVGATGYGCGSAGNNTGPSMYTSIDFGCYGNKCTGSAGGSYCAGKNSSVIDLLFAVIRFLTKGVGLVVIASIVLGGIQYTASRGDPNATSVAVRRITSAVIALVVFIFAYAILNYVIPAGFFSQSL